jgi:hypothetical protein
MESGELCYISITMTGLTIKESDLGFFGKTVLRINSSDLAWLTRSLYEVQDDDLTPPDITNPVLKVITNKVLHLKSLGDIAEIFGAWDSRNRS